MSDKKDLMERLSTKDYMKVVVLHNAIFVSIQRWKHENNADFTTPTGEMVDWILSQLTEIDGKEVPLC